MFQKRRQETRDKSNQPLSQSDMESAIVWRLLMQFKGPSQSWSMMSASKMFRSRPVLQVDLQTAAKKAMLLQEATRNQQPIMPQISAMV